MGSISAVILFLPEDDEDHLLLIEDPALFEFQQAHQFMVDADNAVPEVEFEFRNDYGNDADIL